MGLNMMMPLLWMIVIPNLYTMLSIIVIISSGANQKACYSTNIGMVKFIRFIKRKEDDLSIYMHTHKRFYAQNQKDVHFQKVCCNGKDYDDAIVVNSSNSDINDSGKSLNNEYFIYSKSKGLLEYKYLNGEVYTLYKKLPYKRKD